MVTGILPMLQWVDIKAELIGLSDISKGTEGGADENCDRKLGGGVWGRIWEEMKVRYDHI